MFRLISLLSLSLSLAACIPQTASGATPPNILCIMADDLGWMDLRCQGNEVVSTDHLDQLAREGMRFSNAYAAAPVCSPTRAAMMTGQAPARLHLTNHIPDRMSFLPENPKLLPAPMVNQLAADYLTIAEQFKAAGYATGFMGKWHLSQGGKDDFSLYPDHQGFDCNRGGCNRGGPASYFDPFRNATLPDRKEGQYLPDRLVEEAMDFIDKRGEKPFFICLWYYTVHWPMQAPEVLTKKYADHQGPGLNHPVYGAMIEAMDAATGRLLKFLKTQNLDQETLVIFTSDNGGLSSVADNRPLRSGKGDLYEGGIRVPLIVRWPGRVEAGTTCDEPVISMDLHATMLAAAGLAPPPDQPVDGESLLPLLEQSGSLNREAIYFHYPNYAWHRSNRLGGAVRSGDYKLIERFDDGELELFNLKDDLSEKTNLAKVRPALAESMAQKLRAWREKVDAQMPTRP